MGLDSLVPFDSRNEVGVNGVKRKGWRWHYSARTVHSLGEVATCFGAYICQQEKGTGVRER